jgi:hypothetical protein
MGKQQATRGLPPNTTLSTVDLKYGFPGQVPKNIRHLQFIEEYVKCGDIRVASKACGYSDAWPMSIGAKILKQHHAFLAWLTAHRAQAVIREVGIDQKRVVEEMARIAFANEYDYLVFYEKDEIDPTTQKKTGRKVPWARRKYVHELTREQLTAVIVFRRGNLGSLDWRWRDRDGKLFELGKHLGLFNEKLIHEHRHQHLHMNFDLSKVQMKDLEALEGQFEVLLGQADATK